jgi:hypothetical protein
MIITIFLGTISVMYLLVFTISKLFECGIHLNLSKSSIDHIDRMCLILYSIQHLHMRLTGNMHILIIDYYSN